VALSLISSGVLHYPTWCGISRQLLRLACGTLARPAWINERRGMSEGGAEIAILCGGGDAAECG
jgi:hypothetical protein